MNDEQIIERWGRYFKWIMNDENPSIETCVTRVWQIKDLADKICEEEVHEPLGGMKCGRVLCRKRHPSNIDLYW